MIPMPAADEQAVAALRVPRWALWNHETGQWDEVPPENQPGLWRGGHSYADPAAAHAVAAALGGIDVERLARALHVVARRVDRRLSEGDAEAIARAYAATPAAEPEVPSHE